MTPKAKNFITIVLFGLFCLAFFLGLCLKPEALYSQSERRPLAQRPRLSVPGVLSGDFMEDVESWAKDQFPLREDFRRLKALTVRYVFAQKENNGLYYAEGHLSKLDASLNEAMIDHAAEVFGGVYDRYLAESGGRIYLSVVPDKNFFLAGEEGFPALDYEALVTRLRAQTDFMEYVDIWGQLSLSDYYRTDSHWRQECLIPVARTLAAAMGAELTAEYEEITLDTPFYGVFAGQAALPVAPDELVYLTNDLLDGCLVTSYDTGAPAAAAVYDMEAALGRDPYEMFLCGADALVTVENPAAKTDRELIVFRDSYASSLVPLLAEAYSKITLVDLRYIQSAFLGNFIVFEGQDVLFLYSTSLLNNSLALK